MTQTSKNMLLTEPSVKPDAQHLRSEAARAYSTNVTKQTVPDEEILELLPMVHSLVQRFANYLKAPLSRDDLVSAGTIGLMKAAKNYDSSRNVEFKTYAYIRIKGAIIDELRSSSLLPTNVNQKVKQALETAKQISQQTGSAPNDSQLAEKMGISLEELSEIQHNARAKQFLSIDANTSENTNLLGIVVSEQTQSPEANIERGELVKALAEAITQLPARERQLIVLYYHKNMTMKQIAEAFGVTEPRISQMHSSAIFNLSVKMKDWSNHG